MGVYYDIIGQWYGTFDLMWSGYYYFYYKEIVHNISDETKQFEWKYFQKQHHRIKTKPGWVGESWFMKSLNCLILSEGWCYR